MFFSVTKWVWVKDKEWIKSLRAWNLAKDCRLTNSHNNVQAELLLDGTTSRQFLWTKALHFFVNVKGHGFSSASESTEVYLTATIQGNCSRRSEVAVKFPEMVR